MSANKTTIQLVKNTCERIQRLGVKGETYETIILRLLGETDHLPKLKKTLEQATQKIEVSKKDARFTAPIYEGAEELRSALEEFIRHVESR